MQIIISPAKKMNVDTDYLDYRALPDFIEQSHDILSVLKSFDYERLKKIWKCNDKIAEENYKRIMEMDLEGLLTPAIIAYEGIQYQYMAPSVFEESAFEYVQQHLRILSGFYGILKPLDGVTPYRLEMQAKLGHEMIDSLYEYWGSRLADKLFSESSVIINLASDEYSKCITKYMTDDIRMVTCKFGEMVQEQFKIKATYAKMARGEMVRYMAEHHVEEVEQLKGFDHLEFSFNGQMSSENEFVFVRKV